MLELKHITARALACGGGYPDRALALLEECFREGLAHDPLLASLHGEPRFTALVQAMQAACREDPEFLEPLVGV